MTITDDPQHEAALAEFLHLAQESQTAHRARLLELRDAIDTYENAQGQEPPLPRTVVSLLELEMFKRRVRQRALAQLLDVPDARLSEILRGKRRLNLDFARRLHERLGIPAEVVLRLRDAA